jgi:hypothetical protein
MNLYSNVYNSWPKPKSKSVGLFTDIRLYYDSLELINKFQFISKEELKEELSERVKGLRFIQKFSETPAYHLLRELMLFNWISSDINSSGDTYFSLTLEGVESFELYKKNKQSFSFLLIAKMQQIYVIPAWFINRIWKLSIQRQGEIIIPAPVKSWNPDSRKWEEKNWDNELIEISSNTYDAINQICPGSIIFKKDDWLKKVQISWDRLSNLKRRKVAKVARNVNIIKKEKMKTFSPRKRLSLAMKEAAVKFLFGNKEPYNNKKDFYYSKISPISPRTFMVWCPRLEALELIFYTDMHPNIPGRLIFPVSVFKKRKENEDFEKIENVKNPTGEYLFLHQPKWITFKKDFIETIYSEHQKSSIRVKSLYAPIQDIRDEVCRLLRISSKTFDKFLEKSFEDSLKRNSKYYISLETDTREDQRSGFQILRRPVWINNVPRSLIAITKSKF